LGNGFVDAMSNQGQQEQTPALPTQGRGFGGFVRRQIGIDQGQKAGSKRAVLCSCGLPPPPKEDFLRIDSDKLIVFHDRENEQ